LMTTRLSMWGGMGWGSPSHFSRRVCENFELSLKNCLAGFSRQLFPWFFCQTVCVWLSGKFFAPPTSENYREPWMTIINDWGLTKEIYWWEIRSQLIWTSMLFHLNSNENEITDVVRLMKKNMSIEIKYPASIYLFKKQPTETSKVVDGDLFDLPRWFQPSLPSDSIWYLLFLSSNTISSWVFFIEKLM
jgi:hypothetical protein